MNFKLVLSVVSHILIYTNAQLVPIPANTNLKQIIMLVRHGISAPLYSYPTDPYGPSYWERYGGLGQITSRGLFESYILGQFFKNYYVNFLTPAYSPMRVHVRSLDSDASLMSAMTFLSGMYPPANSDQLWSPQISWFPIPVHTDQRHLDPIFVEECAKFDALVQSSLNTQAYSNIQSQYAAFLKNMTQFTGLPQLSYIDLWKLYDNAISKANNGLPLEPWLADAFQTLAAANDFRVNLRYGDMHKAKLVSGALLFDISKQIRRKTAGSTNELYIYSCEDSHISSLLTLLNATSASNSHLDQVPFSSVLILELSQDSSGLYYVTLRMQSNTTALPVGLIPMNISSCGQTCSLGNFFDMNARNMISSNLREACSLGNSSSYPGESTVTTRFPTSGCVLPGTNGTVFPYHPKKGYSQLELALIIVCSVLGAIILAMIIIIGLICYRNKIRKASF